MLLSTPLLAADPWFFEISGASFLCNILDALPKSIRSVGTETAMVLAIPASIHMQTMI